MCRAAAIDDDHNPILDDRECVEAAFTHLALRDEVNRQYVERFAEPEPARTFVDVSGIPCGARVAVEAVARR